MLSNLYIENIAVIEKLEIEFFEGFTVLTGETGAGKSILIDSINAVLGERTYKDIIRTGANSAYVSALFCDLNNSVTQKLAELDIEYENNSLLIERKLNIDGKTVCKINSRPVSAGVVRELSSLLINIHGQHDSQALLNSDLHYKYIDLLAANENILLQYGESFTKVKAKLKGLKNFRQLLEINKEQQELYQYQAEEISGADIKVGETDKLKSRKEQVLNHTKIITSFNTVNQFFLGNDDTEGINSSISKAVKELSLTAKYIDSITTISEKLASIEYDLLDISREIEYQLDSLDYDNNELDVIEQRLDLLDKLSKKYGADEQDILDFFDSISKKIVDIEQSDEKIEKLEQELETEYNHLNRLAEQLTESRTTSAKEFEKNVINELKELNMPSAEFLVQITPTKLNELGAEQIEFLISANKGETPKPLAKIASGGELSRVMLAIKSILAYNDEVHTLIFDEIDTGISGRAAQSVGSKIKQVATAGKQIICVTHLAQIAGLGKHHYIIKKNESDGSTTTTVELLNKTDRIREIARIIGGENITENTLKSAEEILSN